jgi:hypothetical protein
LFPLGYKDDRREAQESKTLERFKAEFARMQGPKWRGTSHELGRKLDSDSPEMHARYLEQVRTYRKKK